MVREINPENRPLPPLHSANQRDLSVRKAENGNDGTRVSDHLVHQTLTPTNITSIKEIDLSAMTEVQRQVLQDLAVIADGASQALLLLEDSQAEKQNPSLAFLEQAQSSSEAILDKNESLREILGLAANIVNFTSEQLERMDSHNAISDMARIVSYVLKQYIENEEGNEDSKLVAQQSLDKIQSQLPSENAFDPSSVLNFPSVASSMYSVLKWLKHIEDIPALTFGFAGATAVAASAISAIEMKANMNIDAKHQAYGKELAPLKVELLKATIETPEEIKHVLLPSEKAAKQLETLVEKRQKNHASRLEKEAVSLDQFLAELSESGPRPLDSFLRLLKKKGIDLDALQGGDSIKTLEELKIKLKDPEFKMHVLEQRIRYKDGMTSTAKSLLREVLLDNQKVNQKLFSWKLLKSKINFSGSVFIGAATIALAAAVFAGLSIAFFPIMIPTLVGVALGAGLALTGLIILAKNKPNLLKEILLGTKIKLAFYELPRTFDAWRLKVNQLELQENNLALLQFLEARPLTLEGLKAFKNAPQEDIPPYLLDLYQKLQKKKEVSIKDLKKFEVKENELLEEGKKLSKVVENYAKQLNFYEEKVKAIQDRLNEARAKDLVRNTKFSIKDFEIIAESLVEGEFWQDQEAVQFMNTHLGLNLEPLKNQYISFETKERLKYILDKKMRDAILQNSTQLIEWLKKRDM